MKAEIIGIMIMIAITVKNINKGDNQSDCSDGDININTVIIRKWKPW